VNNNIYDGSYQLVDSQSLLSEWGFTCNTGQAGETTTGARRRARTISEAPPAYKRAATPTSLNTVEEKFKRLEQDVAFAIMKRSFTSVVSERYFSYVALLKAAGRHATVSCTLWCVPAAPESAPLTAPKLAVTAQPVENSRVATQATPMDKPARATATVSLPNITIYLRAF
jgi:hypothetical protein